MITPWWQVLRLRPEVSSNSGNIDDVQMSLFRAVYSIPAAPYSDPIYYGAITYPTASLVALIARVAVRLGGDNYTSVPSLFHLDQGMGGGKSHGLIGLYHLANNPTVFVKTDIGQLAWSEAKNRLGGAEPKLNDTHIVVLSADRMTPFAPDKRREMDGPAMTLWERFLWRLVDSDYNLYDRYKSRWDQEAITEALTAIGRPILILIDEIMDYVRQLDDTKYEGMRNAELAFLKSLFDAVNDVPHVAMVVVMISSDKDKGVYGKGGLAFRDEMLANFVRNGKNTAVTEASDFSQIIRRRLFENSAPTEVIVSTASSFTNISTQWKAVLSKAKESELVDLPAEIARSYPFHPSLLRLVETEWANLAGYQRVRSTVTLFAQTTFTWLEHATRGEWAPLLIGSGDIPLDQIGVREALLGSGIIESETTVANYRQVIATDLVGEGGESGVAARLDKDFVSRDTWATSNPRAAQRMATALLLYSLTPRPGGKLGATDAEIKAASFVPDLSFAATDAETIFNALKDAETGLGALNIMAGQGGQPPRFQLTTRQTLQMLFRAQRSAVTEKDRDLQVAAVAERLIRQGSGFSKVRFVRDEKDSFGRSRSDAEIFVNLDERNVTRLCVLDPSRWTLLNGRDDETRRAIRMAFGVGQGGLAVTHASSLVIACVNTQRRSLARQRAAEFLAWTRVANIEVVRDDAGLLAQANNEVQTAKVALEKEVNRSFQHFAYLIRDAQGALDVRFAKFDDDSKSSLSGANIWDQLVETGRAVKPGALKETGLLLALEGELPRTLSEVVALFWTNPRIPMISSIDELRNALFNALKSSKLQLVNAEGKVFDILDRPSDLPIGSSTITIQVPKAELENELEMLEGSADNGNQGKILNEVRRGYESGSVGILSNPSFVEDNDTTSEKTVARAELWMKKQSDLSSEARRINVITLLNRLKNVVDDGAIEGIVLTIDLIGNKDRLGEIVNISQSIEGGQYRLEDLPN